MIQRQRRPGHEQHERAGRENQQRGAEIRLADNQNERQADQAEADRDVLEVRRQSALGQVPGDGRRHDDLHEFRRLEADHPGNIDPARRTHGVVAHDIHRHQQQHPEHISSGHPARHESGLKLGNDKHRHQTDAERGGLFDQQVPAFAAGRIQHEQTARRQRQQQNQQRAIDVDFLQERSAAAHHIFAGKDAVEITLHGPRSPEAVHCWRIRVSGGPVGRATKRP
jgi:hypothetical protein